MGTSQKARVLSQNERVHFGGLQNLELPHHHHPGGDCDPLDPLGRADKIVFWVGAGGPKSREKNWDRAYKPGPWKLLKRGWYWFPTAEVKLQSSHK